MRRAYPLAFVLLAVSVATAADADLPKDISAEDREAVIRNLRTVYSAEHDKWAAQAEDAKTLMKFKATEKEGKQKLAKAEAELARLAKEPASWTIPKSPIVLFGDVPARTGRIGHLNNGGWMFVVSEVLPNGVLVDAMLKEGAKVSTARYFIASPVEVPKKGKNPEIRFPGLWYVAGTAEIKGKVVPVLYRFEVKKADIVISEKK